MLPYVKCQGLSLYVIHSITQEMTCYNMVTLCVNYSLLDGQ